MIQEFSEATVNPSFLQMPAEEGHIETVLLNRMKAASVIDFNLEGMDLNQAYSYSGPCDWPNVTNWEFQQILKDPDLMRKTRFWNMPKAGPGM